MARGMWQELNYWAALEHSRFLPHMGGGSGVPSPTSWHCWMGSPHTAQHWMETKRWLGRSERRTVTDTFMEHTLK